MAKLLDHDQIQHWNQNGIVFPIAVLSENEINQYHSDLADLEARLGGRPKAAELLELNLYYRWAHDLANHSRVLDAVEDVLGADILVWGCGVFTKYPQDASYVSWHQDGTYWGLDEGKIVTAWIALTPSTPANGCMRVVPGSHRQPIQPHVETYADDNLLSRGQEVQVDVDESEAMDVVLNAGEMSLHDVRLIHGSNDNPTDTKRAGFAVRYITPGVRPAEAEQTVTLARGEDRYGHFPRQDSPPTAPVAEAVAAHTAAVRQYMEMMRRTKGNF